MGLNSIPFIITIDVEGDNAWSKPERVATENAKFLARFHELCVKYGQRPTYLTNYEMALDPVYQELVNDPKVRGECEIGMHLHGWDTPPLEPLTDKDYWYQPYITEYPKDAIFAKIETMTRLVEDKLNVKPVSHRSGRWAWDDTVHEALLKFGYRVDCSLTPYFDWKKGDILPGSGVDGLRHYDTPPRAHRMALREALGLLQVPFLSQKPKGIGLSLRRGLPWKPLLARRVIDKLFSTISLRPSINSKENMIGYLKATRAERAEYVEFMIHSSEFMPGGSPYYPNEAAVERLYEDIEAVFAEASTGFVGTTLAEFCDLFEAKEGR